MQKTRQRHLTIERENSAWNPAFVAHVAVAPLSSELTALLGVNTLAKQILLPIQGRHIRKQRLDEARSVIASIPNALTRIRYLGNRELPHEYTLVGKLDDKRLLLVGIKFVPANRASSNQDEALLTTSHYLGQDNLKRMLKKNSFILFALMSHIR